VRGGDEARREFRECRREWGRRRRKISAWLATFHLVYYMPNRLIMSVENVCCRGRRRRPKAKGLPSRALFSPFFYCFTRPSARPSSSSVSSSATSAIHSQSGHPHPAQLGTCRATLMLSFGKLMKMCGVFISCESLTDRNLIAPFFCGFWSLFLPLSLHSGELLRVVRGCRGWGRKPLWHLSPSSSDPLEPFMSCFSAAGNDSRGRK
jgi:hypothetical protein